MVYINGKCKEMYHFESKIYEYDCLIQIKQRFDRKIKLDSWMKKTSFINSQLDVGRWNGKNIDRILWNDSINNNKTTLPTSLKFKKHKRCIDMLSRLRSILKTKANVWQQRLKRFGVFEHFICSFNDLYCIKNALNR